MQAVGRARAARGRRGPTAAAVLLAGVFAITARKSRDVAREAFDVARAREDHQRRLAGARFGNTLSGAHDAVNAVGGALAEALADAPAGTWRPAAFAALERLDSIGLVLRDSREVRDAMADENGRVPVVGGHAAHIRAANPLKPYHGSLTDVPLPLRGTIRQVGLVFDEVRVLHNSDIERSVLLMTLAARAVLVTMSPMLESWTVARVPLEGEPRLGDAAWLAAAIISLGTASRARTLVERAMEDSASARKLRGRLLVVEVPVAAIVIVTCPAWTVAVFATGWTNWWQRQTPRLAFDWRKLAAFVAAVVALQTAGLAQNEVSPLTASREIAAALLAIAVIGGSYGAMLPLSVATALSVLVGDSRRSLRTLRAARDELSACARALDRAAIEIDAAAPDAPAARGAAGTARQAARQLDRAVDRVGRRALFASHVLAEVAGEAIARSYLPRRGSRELEELRRRALARDEPEPAFATEPIFEPRSLHGRRIRRQKDARTLRAIIERGLNEAGLHGTGAARIVWTVEGEELVLRIGNRPRARSHVGTGGEGGRAIERLARKLPRGSAPPRGLRPASDIRVPGGGEWWLVETRCALEIADSGDWVGNG